jgi:hypothetical protein
MPSSLIVEVSRRATRALDLGKGMFFDADAMAVLAECGALDAIQSASSQYLKERAAERLEERSTARRSVARRNFAPAEVEAKPFQIRRRPDLRLVGAEAGRNELPPREDEAELLARVKRKLTAPPRSKLKPK